MLNKVLKIGLNVLQLIGKDNLIYFPLNFTCL